MALHNERHIGGAWWARLVVIAVFCLPALGYGDEAAKKDGPSYQRAHLPAGLPLVPSVTAESMPERTVGAVLDRMLKAYHHAQSYHDEAVINVHLHGPKGDDAADFDAKLEFKRPNLLRMEFQPVVFRDGELVQRVVVSDGKKVYAKSEGYENQVVVADAPTHDVAKALFASKTVGPLLTDKIVGHNLVLGLLTSDELPAPLDRAKAKLLEQANLDGHDFDRVEFATANGSLTLWIDPESSVIRRIEFPTAKLLKDLKKTEVSAIEVTADLDKADLYSERFAWNKSDGETFVRGLVQPPDLADVGSKLLGHPAPTFQFVTPSGDKRAVVSLAGKVTVIDFWATWCGECLKGLPAVDQIRKKYTGNNQVQFLALSEDKPEVKNQDIVDVLKGLKVDVPWVRVGSDNPDELNAAFQFNGIPAMIVLGPDGRVWFHHIGYDPHLEAKLVPVIDALLAGKDPSANAAAERDSKLREYQRRLAEVRVDPPADR